jgi:hypothetical protein
VAGVAAVISSQDGDADVVPFFVGLTVLGGVVAWAAHDPFVGRRRLLAQIIALVWLLAAFWVGALLLVYAGGGSAPPPGPAATYLGLTATAYHLAGLYGGLALVLAAAFAPARWFDRLTSGGGDRASGRA